MRIGRLVDIPLSGDMSGKSNSFGFTIKSNKKTVKSKNYNQSPTSLKQESEALEKYGIFLMGGAILAGCIWLLAYFFTANTLEDTISSVLYILFGVIMFFINLIAGYALMVIVFYKNLWGNAAKEYHACEHMANSLLRDKKLEPTLDNLRRMPRVTIWCGSAIIGFLAVASILTSLKLILFLVLPGLDAVIAPISILMMFIIPLALQFFFATAKPSEEKLEETMEVIKEFYK